MLTRRERKSLENARMNADVSVITVKSHERSHTNLGYRSYGMRIKKWENLEAAITSLSSYIERYGVSPGDEARFDRFIEYLRDAKRIAKARGSSVK